MVSMPLTLTLIPLVPFSLLLHSFSDTSPLHLRYTSVMPPLYIRFVNEGRSSSQRRMIEFTTKDERRTNEELTKEHIYKRDGQHTNLHSSLKYSAITAQLETTISWHETTVSRLETIISCHDTTIFPHHDT